MSRAIASVPSKADQKPDGQGGQPRVLMVTAAYRPAVGGTITHVSEVARRFGATNERATSILTTDTSGTLPKIERDDSGIVIRRIHAWPRTGPLNDFYLAPGIGSTIRRERHRWDILHLQGYHTLVAPMALQAAWQAGIPYVVTFHSGGRTGGLRGAIREAQLQMLRPLLARARRLIAVSHFEAEFFRDRLRLPADRFVVIPNGVNLPNMVGAPAVRAGTGPLLVSTGRLESYKGHQRVITALPHLLPAYPDIRLQIVGTGPYEGELHSLAASLGLSERVTIGSLPPADRTAMVDLLRRASLVISLSSFESQGIGIGEAIALGRPALVANATALAELVDRGLAHGLALESNPEETAMAIHRALDVPRLRAHDAMLPTWDDCAADLAALYRREAGARMQARG
jgi:glycosyltransferase involved in cell wall biosynthesis